MNITSTFKSKLSKKLAGENLTSSAASRGDRPGLTRVLEILRAGETLVVWKLDRLGRSVKHLIDLVASRHG